MSQPQPPPPPPRPSPRAQHLHPKTTSPNSNNGVHAAHHRRGSPKPDDSRRRSPRSPLLESPARNLRKSGGRAAELQTKLGRAQEELGKLREQLASAEAARRDVQQKLEDARKLLPAGPAGDGEKQDEDEERTGCVVTQRQDVQEREDAAEITAPAAPATTPAEKDAELEAKLDEKMEEIERCSAENASLRRQLAEAEAEAGAARASEEETASKLSRAAEELARSEERAGQLGEQLAAAEGAKAALEADTRRMRVQTEQWRKAADAAAAALSGTESEMRKVAERCPSMDRLMVAGHDGLGSPPEGGLGGGPRKAAGIRALGELWRKKKGQLHE